MLRTSNPDREGQADPVNRGGIYRSASSYSVEDYDYWQRELGRDDSPFGQFGENFTVEGMLEDDILYRHIGDVFRVGHVLVEVLHPRPPWFELGIKMGMAQFPKLLLESGCEIGLARSWMPASPRASSSTCSPSSLTNSPQDD